MFRLLKLCAYGLLGYALYEFVRGMTTTAQSEGASSARRSSGSGSQRSFAGSGRRENITGPEGSGQQVETAESDGGAIRHRVGRGVVHR